MHFYNRAEKIQCKARNCFMGLSLLAICLLAVSFSGGCANEVPVPVPTLQLSLNAPEISEKTVSVNGAASAPVDRIQWEWGDGQTDKHIYFPAHHVYKNPGKYQINVTVFDTKNNKSATKSVSVEIK